MRLKQKQTTAKPSKKAISDALATKNQIVRETGELSELRKKAQEAVAEQENVLAALDAKLESTNRDVFLAKAQLEEVIEQISHNTSILAAIKDEYESVSDMLEKIKRAAEKTHEEMLKRFESEAREAQDLIEHLDDKCDALRQERSSLEDCLEKLNKDHEALKKAHGKLGAEAAEKLKYFQALSVGITELEMGRENAEKEKQKYDAVLSGIKKEIEKQNVVFRSSKAENEKLALIIENQQAEVENNKRVLLVQQDRLKTIDRREKELDRRYKEAGLK